MLSPVIVAKPAASAWAAHDSIAFQVQRAASLAAVGLERKTKTCFGNLMDMKTGHGQEPQPKSADQQRGAS